MKDFNAAGRVIFALSFSPSRLKSTFFPTPVENVLISYYYIQSENKERYKVQTQLVADVRKKAKKVFIDSGIFTLKTKYVKGFSVSGSFLVMPKDQVNKFRHEATKNIKMFDRFARRYTKWLTKFDRLYDWAFDLDVDEFLGKDIADRYYQILKETIPNPRKIIRVWHGLDRTWDDWVRWCESGEHDYLAVEGGGSHSMDYDFYRRMIAKAHEHGIKVHVLAATSADFMKNVPCDTADSSSWMTGSRYGYIYTPYGKISFGKKTAPSMNHWDTLPKEHKAKIMEWLHTAGVAHRISEFKHYWEPRELANIAYFLWADKPFERTGKVFRQSIAF